MNLETTSRDFFEQKYRGGADPWNFASDPYERNRYRAILNAINHRRYRRVFEPGCSVGELTARLATICDHVEASDIAPSAVAQARERCYDLPNVRVTCAPVEALKLRGNYDLIAFCEIGYYFDELALHKLARRLVGHLSDCGVLVAAHWLGESEDHILSGDAVHRILRATSGIVLTSTERRPGFRLETWTKDRWVRQ